MIEASKLMETVLESLRTQLAKYAHPDNPEVVKLDAAAVRDVARNIAQAVILGLPEYGS
jgi:hypothetical protein